MRFSSTSPLPRSSGSAVSLALAVVVSALAVSLLAGGCAGSVGSTGSAGSAGMAAAGAAPTGPTTAAPAVRAAPVTPRASAVLHRWDRARAEAYASGDLADLRRLYVPGSRAGTADVRTLSAYLARGLRVEGMRMQLLAVTVLEERPGRIRLQVTDRLTGAVAVDPQGRVRLPSDSASARVVVLVRSDAGWQVAGVSDRALRSAGP